MRIFSPHLIPNSPLLSAKIQQFFFLASTIMYYIVLVENLKYSQVKAVFASCVFTADKFS